MPDPPWPIKITAVGDATCATVAYREQGQLYATAIIKASFALVPGGVMEPVSPRSINVRDRHHDDDPVRSLQSASDLVPHLPQADVVLTGRAYGGSLTPVTSCTARLKLSRGGKARLDKSLLVQGPRSGDGPTPGRPQPFFDLPLMYERAAGGPGDRHNPVGISADSGRHPNISCPPGKGTVAGFGPVARHWPGRRTHLGKANAKAMETALANGEILEIPAQFDWAYFQAAPADQQLDSLYGDETIILECLHPTVRAIETRLPKIRTVAQLFGPKAPKGKALMLWTDRLIIEPERGVASLTWRGRVALESPKMLRTHRIAAVLELPAMRGKKASKTAMLPISNPGQDPPPLDTASQSATDDGRSQSLVRTLGDKGDDPFARWVQARRDRDSAIQGDQTLDFTSGDSTTRGQTLPFEQPVRGKVPQAAQQRPPEPRPELSGQTLDFDEDSSPGITLPFANDRRDKGHTDSDIAEIIVDFENDSVDDEPDVIIDVEEDIEEAKPEPDPLEFTFDVESVRKPDSSPLPFAPASQPQPPPAYNQSNDEGGKQDHSFGDTTLDLDSLAQEDGRPPIPFATPSPAAAEAPPAEQPSAPLAAEPEPASVPPQSEPTAPAVPEPEPASVPPASEPTAPAPPPSAPHRTVAMSAQVDDQTLDIDSAELFSQGKTLPFDAEAKPKPPTPAKRFRDPPAQGGETMVKSMAELFRGESSTPFVAESEAADTGEGLGSTFLKLLATSTQHSTPWSHPELDRTRQRF